MARGGRQEERVEETADTGSTLRDCENMNVHVWLGDLSLFSEYVAQSQ